MSQMQSPYQDASNVSMYQEPERTSIMAVLSMVFGVGGCCLGVTSIPAILLGILGLVGISRSKGRVGGTGFGIAGIIVGLLTLAIWIGLIFGIGGAAKSSMSLLTGKVKTVLTDIQSDKFDAARTGLASPAADVPDEALIAFREAYRASIGNYVSEPNGLGDLISGYMAVGQLIQPYSGKPGYVPLPMRFDSGWVLVIYVMDTTGSTTNAGVPNPIELILVDAKGNEFKLPPAGLATPAPTPPTTPAPDADGDDGQDNQTPGDETTDEEDGQGP